MSVMCFGPSAYHLYEVIGSFTADMLIPLVEFQLSKHDVRSGSSDVNRHSSTFPRRDH